MVHPDLSPRVVSSPESAMSQFRTMACKEKLSKHFRSFMSKEGLELLNRLVDERLAVVAQRKSVLVTNLGTGWKHRGVQSVGQLSEWKTACGWAYGRSKANVSLEWCDIDAVQANITCDKCRGSKSGIPVTSCFY